MTTKLLKIKDVFKALKIFFATILFWSINILIVVFAWLVAPVLALIMWNKNSAYQKWAKIWGKALLAIAATQVRIEGLENIPKGIPIIYTPNHQSNLDWMILLAVLPLPFRFIIKKELFRIPLFGSIIRNAGYFSLNREAKRKAYNTLIETIDVAKKDSIVIFPEGTRTWDGNLGKFKRGSLLLAFKVGSPIIPVAISGSFEIMPRHTWVINPGIVKVKIGYPVSFGEHKETKQERYQITLNKTRDAITTMLSELKRKRDD